MPNTIKPAANDFAKANIVATEKASKTPNIIRIFSHLRHLLRLSLSLFSYSNSFSSLSMRFSIPFPILLQLILLLLHLIKPDCRDGQFRLTENERLM